MYLIIHRINCNLWFTERAKKKKNVRVVQKPLNFTVRRWVQTASYVKNDAPHATGWSNELSLSLSLYIFFVYGVRLYATWKTTRCCRFFLVLYQCILRRDIAPSLCCQANTVENYNVLANDIRVAFRDVSLFVAIETLAYISEVRPDVPSAMVKSVVP